MYTNDEHSLFARFGKVRCSVPIIVKSHMSRRSREPLLFSRYRRRAMLNPFYPRHAHRRPWKKIGTISALAVALFLGFVFGSPIFVVHAIQVQGTHALAVSDIEGTIRSALSRRSYIFLIRTQTVDAAITKAFPVESVTVRRRYPATLIVTVQERIPFAVWQVKDVSWLIDRRGVVLRASTPDEVSNSAYLHFEDEGDRKTPAMGDTLVSAESLATIAGIKSDIEHAAGVAITSLIIPTPETGSIKLKTTEGWFVYFSFSLSNPTGNTRTAQQIEKLIAVLRDSIKDRSKLEYVDVRFEDRVYFK